MNTVSAFFELDNPLAWLAGSLAAAIISTHLAWWLSYRIKLDRTRSPIHAMLLAAGWLAVSLFFVLPPFAAWRLGVLSPFHLGLTEIDWIASLAAGAPLAAAVAALLLFQWLIYRRFFPAGARGQRLPAQRAAHAFQAFLDCFTSQWHWAFYRACVIGWLAGVASLPGPLDSLRAEPLYWGAWLGLLAIAAEWVLNPFARAALRTAETRAAALRSVLLAIATTGLFAVSRNLWICLACQMAVEVAVAGWFALPGQTESTIQ